MRADEFSGPWLRALAWIHAALQDPARLDEALRQLLGETSALSIDLELLLPVLIERAETVQRRELAETGWSELAQVVQDDLSMLLEEPQAWTPVPPEEAPRELELPVRVGNAELDVRVTLPAFWALRFLNEVTADPGRPEWVRLTADLCLACLDRRGTPPSA